MAHEVETMMYVGETPWHKLGRKLENPPTTKEAMIAAGLDWEVYLQPLFTVNGVKVDHQATVRTSDGSVLGVVGPTYKPVQNSDAFAFFDPFLAAGEASIETAGSLREGSRIWVLAKLNRDPSVIVPGDDVSKYILLANSHDGTLAARVGFTPVRVVCANTLAMANNNRASKLIRVKHTKNAKATLEAVRDVMNAANAEFEATADQFRALAAKPINSDDLVKYVRTVFKNPAVQKAEAEAEISGSDMLSNLLSKPITSTLPSDVAERQEQRRTRTDGLVEDIVQLFETGAGNNLPGVRGTMWGAYNAVTDYLTHHRGRSEENRLLAQMTDAGGLNDRALSTALAML